MLQLDVLTRTCEMLSSGSHGLFAILPNLGPTELIIVGVVAVLLFGKRLPEVGRSVGKSFMEFKKGISGIQDELDTSVNRPASRSSSSRSGSSGAPRSYDYEDREEATAPKFEPPPAEESNTSTTAS